MEPESSCLDSAAMVEPSTSSMDSLLAVHYATCPECRQRIRIQRYNVLSRCHSWCPRCKKNVLQCLR